MTFVVGLPIETAPGCGPLRPAPAADSHSLRQRVFEHIRAAGAVPRRDIARALDVSPGSVTQITSDLIGTGLLQETEADLPSPRGRPPVALSVAPGRGHVVGIKLADEQRTAVLLDQTGTLLAEAERPSRGPRLPPAALVTEADALLDAVLKDTGLARSDVARLGVGLPGIVDPITATVPWSPILDEADAPLGRLMSTALGLPVDIENDTNVLTLAELWFGQGRCLSDFAVVSIESGLGLGMVLGGRLFRGARGLGTELGHTKVQLDGALCRCGQRGCLEAYVADYALVREGAAALGVSPAGTTAETLSRLHHEADAGNEAARAVFRRAGRFLALGLANIVQLFDPARIILSGVNLDSKTVFLDEMLSNIAALTLNTSRPPTPVEVHAWGGPVWARGAAALALQAATDAAFSELR